MPLTVAELDAAIDALALGAESYTLPNGTSVKRTSLKDVMTLRELRKRDEENAGSDIVPQCVEFES